MIACKVVPWYLGHWLVPMIWILLISIVGSGLNAILRQFEVEQSLITRKLLECLGLKRACEQSDLGLEWRTFGQVMAGLFVVLILWSHVVYWFGTPLKQRRPVSEPPAVHNGHTPWDE